MQLSLLISTELYIWCGHDLLFEWLQHVFYYNNNKEASHADLRNNTHFYAFCMIWIKHVWCNLWCPRWKSFCYNQTGLNRAGIYLSKDWGGNKLKDCMKNIGVKREGEYYGPSLMYFAIKEWEFQTLRFNTYYVNNNNLIGISGPYTLQPMDFHFVITKQKLGNN